MSGRLSLSPDERVLVLEWQRRMTPFLVWRGPVGELAYLDLGGRRVVAVGRRSSNDLSLDGDAEASRVHARLEVLGEQWILYDDGISRNGTFVGGSRVRRAHRLNDGDEIRFGRTRVRFHNPAEGSSVSTDAPSRSWSSLPPKLNPTQERILVALSRPVRNGEPAAVPATNAEISREVFLGVDAVKANLRLLYQRFGIELPQNQKRAELARRALQLDLPDDAEE